MGCLSVVIGYSPMYRPWLTAGGFFYKTPKHLAPVGRCCGRQTILLGPVSLGSDPSDTVWKSVVISP